MPSHCLDRAAKLGQHAVAAGAEDAALVSGDQPVDHVAILAEALECRFLVRAHKARIPLDIGCEDRGQLPRDFIFRQVTYQNSTR